MTRDPQAGVARPLNADAPGSDDFRLLAEQLPTPAAIGDAAGAILWGNRLWRARNGATLALPAAAAIKWRAGTAHGVAFDLTCDGGVVGDSDDPARSMTLHIAPLPVIDDRPLRWFAVGGEGHARQQAEAARDTSQAQFDVLTNAMPQMVWSTRPDGFHDYYNAQWYAFTGVPAGSTDGEGWSDMFHPDDQPQAWARWRHSLATGDPYEVEYRLRHHSGDWRWTLGRALPVRDADGAIVRWIGTCTDIDAAKRAADHTEILSRELSHRIKNIFAVIGGLVRLSARREPALRDFADELGQRIGALARAHDLARPHSNESRPQVGEATLHQILRALLDPYPAHQIAIAGDDVAIDDRGATPLALVFHELATNAAKYGALATADGSLRLESVVDGEKLTIRWLEAGGPPVVPPTAPPGFGTRLIALSIEQQLGGKITRDWNSAGLEVAITVNRSALVRDPI